MATTTLNWQLRDALKHLSKGGRLSVLTSYILHANTRNRVWISIDKIVKETGLSKPTVVAAKKWLEDSGAIVPVPNDKRVDKELELHHLIDVFEITGLLTIDGKQYPYLYANPESLGSENEPKEESLGKNSLRKEFYTEGSIKDSLEVGSKESAQPAESPNGNHSSNGDSTTAPAVAERTLFIAILDHAYGITYTPRMSIPTGTAVNIQACIKALNTELSPPATVAEIDGYYTEARKGARADYKPVKSPKKLPGYILEYRQKHTPIPRPTPLAKPPEPVKPMTPEGRQKAADFLEEARRQRLAKKGQGL